MGLLSLGEGQPAVDRGAHERVGEAQRVARAQHVRAPKLLGGRERVGCRHPGERRGHLQRDVVLEHRDGACQRLRVRRQGAEPAQHRAPERAGRHLGRCRQRLLTVRALLVLDRQEQLAHLQRVAGRQLEAAPAERVAGFGATAPKQRGHRGGAEWRQRANAGDRVAAELFEQAPLAALARAGGDQHRDRLVGQAAYEVDQEPQRGLVGPLGVVDCEQQRSALGEAHREPIQRVQDRKPPPSGSCLPFSPGSNTARAGRAGPDSRAFWAVACATTLMRQAISRS